MGRSARAGRPLRELPETELCCGSAGVYNLNQAEMSDRLARRKLEGDGIRAGMLYRDGTLFVQGNSGSLHALEIQVR